MIKCLAVALPLFQPLSAAAALPPAPANHTHVLSSHACGARIHVRFTRPSRCRGLRPADCTYFYITLHGVARPCTSIRRDGACVAGTPTMCTEPVPAFHRAGRTVRTALRRMRSLQRRAVASRMGEPCLSAMSGDATEADCESWCAAAGSNDSLACAAASRLTERAHARSPVSSSLRCNDCEAPCAIC
jgi:hypothetical protein